MDQWLSLQDSAGRYTAHKVAVLDTRNDRRGIVQVAYESLASKALAKAADDAAEQVVPEPSEPVSPTLSPPVHVFVKCLGSLWRRQHARNVADTGKSDVRS